MNDLLTSEEAQSLPTNIRLLLGVCFSVISGLVFAVIKLWKTLEKKNSYIIEQDKGNLLVLTEIVNNHKIIGLDVSDIKNSTNNEIKPKVEEIRQTIKRSLR